MAPTTLGPIATEQVNFGTGGAAIKDDGAGNLVLEPEAILGNFRIVPNATSAVPGPSIRTDAAGEIVINPAIDQPLFLNWDGGGSEVIFGDGNSNAVGSVDAAGRASFRNLTIANDPTQPQDGATKHYVDEAIAESGNFVYPAAGITVSTGSSWAAPINPATLATWPAAGVPQSTGAAWGASIPAATLARTNAANTFTADQTIAANLGIKDAANNTTGTLRTVGPDTLISPPTGALFLNWDSGNGGVWFGNGAGASVGRIPANGVARFNGGLQIGSSGQLASIDGTGTLSLAGSASINQGVVSTSFLANSMAQIPAQGTMRLGYDTASGYLDAFGPNAATVGSMHFRVLSGDSSTYHDALIIESNGATDIAGNLKADQLMSRTNGWLLLNRDSGTAVYFGNGTGGTVGSVDNVGNANFSGTVKIGDNANPSLRIGTRGDASVWATGSANINSDGNGLIFNAAGLYFNWDRPGSTQFGNGLGGPVVTIDKDGNIVCTSIAAGSKTFKITHPLDASKHLIHGCLEGPEHGVYYRGEAETTNGSAEITLPDYFEALTAADYGRTVQLTQIFDTDADPLVILAASRVMDGKFRVRSSLSTAKFCWEVKAIRADIGPLAVVTDKEPAPDPQPNGEQTKRHSGRRRGI